ncbi:SpoIIIAH-like family protein [Marinicrinis sediminis]|uniref:SpoIIIAH-like family protein n=1 Tax=Marinicrinis sediminis TaxID=1652465 RepID=A0ABW5RDV1_9BACL
MNTRRQTVWLVSMLSLMVILSAYYLFTEDVTDSEMASNPATISTNEIVVDEVTEQQANGSWPDELLALEGESSVQDTGEEPEDLPASAESEANILAQLEQQGQGSSEDYFATILMNRNESFSKKADELMQIITEASDATMISDAHNQLLELEEKEAKISDMESTLMEQFDHVLITEDANQWQVLVRAADMQKSEAVTITEMMMSELQVNPSQVVIKMVR